MINLRRFCVMVMEVIVSFVTVHPCCRWYEGVGCRDARINPVLTYNDHDDVFVFIILF